MSDISPVNESAEKISVDAMKKNYENLSKPIKNDNSKDYNKKSLGINDTEKEVIKNINESYPQIEQPNHRITVTLLFANSDFESIDVSEYMQSFTVSKMFEELFKPIYILNFVMPLYIINAVLKSKNYKFRIQIETVDYIHVVQESRLANITNDGNFNKVLDIFVIPFTTPDNIINESAEDLIRKNDDRALKTRFNFKIEGFDERHVRSAHSLISTNYRNQPLKNILVDLINKNKDNCMPKINNLIFCEPDTSEYIDNLTIPPMNLSNTLEYIQEKINIYNRKAIFFIDNDTFYIMKRSYTPKLKDGTNHGVNVIIASYTNFQEKDDLNNVLSSMSGTNIPLIMTNITPKYINRSAEVANSIGDKIMIKSDSSTSGLVSGCLGVVDSDPKALDSARYAMENSVTNTLYDGKEVFKRLDSESKLKMNLMIDEAQAESYKIDLKFRDIRIDLIKPTTILNLKIMDKSAKDSEGQYYIRNALFVYTRNPSTGIIEMDSSIEVSRRFNDNQEFVK